MPRSRDQSVYALGYAKAAQITTTSSVAAAGEKAITCTTDHIVVCRFTCTTCARKGRGIGVKHDSCEESLDRRTRHIYLIDL
jgi:hypothetical protein